MQWFKIVFLLFLTPGWQEDTNTEATKYILVQCCAVLLSVTDFEVLIHAY